MNRVDDVQAFDALSAEAASKDAARAGDRVVQPCPLKPKVRVRIALRDRGYHLRPNVKYSLVADGAKYEGTTGADGVLDHLLPTRPGAGRLTLWEDPDQPDPTRVWDLEFDTVHPIGVPTGVQARLANLGYRVEEAGESGPLTKAAIAEFQSMVGLDPSGKVDSPTRAQLRKISDTTDGEGLDDEPWIPGAYGVRKE